MRRTSTNDDPRCKGRASDRDGGAACRCKHLVRIKWFCTGNRSSIWGTVYRATRPRRRFARGRPHCKAPPGSLYPTPLPGDGYTVRLIRRSTLDHGSARLLARAFSKETRFYRWHFPDPKEYHVGFPPRDRDRSRETGGRNVTVVQQAGDERSRCLCKAVSHRDHVRKTRTVLQVGRRPTSSFADCSVHRGPYRTICSDEPRPPRDRPWSGGVETALRRADRRSALGRGRDRAIGARAKGPEPTGIKRSRQHASSPCRRAGLAVPPVAVQPRSLTVADEYWSSGPIAVTPRRGRYPTAT